MPASLPLLGLLTACGGSYDMAAAEDGALDRAADTGSSGDETFFDPEDEDDFLELLPPAATSQYVFVANPDRDTVTRIAVPELSVITASVGVRPTVVLTSPDTSSAITLDVGSDTVSIIDGASLAVSQIEVRPNLNQMRMSPDGEWVICYHDPAVEDEDALKGTQSFYEVSLVEVATGRHVPAVAGFEPQDVLFTPDGQTALIVSDAQASIVDLTTKDPTLELVEIAADPLDPPPLREVVLAPSGEYAFLRQQGENELLLLDIPARTVDSLPVGADPTDLDISPDGLEAIAVARSDHELWIYDLADPFAPADIVPLPLDESFGSIVMSPDNTKALVFTTTGVARYGTWDRTTDEVSVRGLEKSVSTVGISPDGGTALVLHPADNDDVDPASPFWNKHALTMIDLDDFRSNALSLPGEPKGYANSSGGEYGFLIMEGIAEVDVLDYASLLYEPIALSSAAEEVGVLPETTWTYVSQTHDLGRISFYEPDTDVLQTLTGFELNAAIEQAQEE